MAKISVLIDQVFCQEFGQSTQTLRGSRNKLSKNSCLDKMSSPFYLQDLGKVEFSRVKDHEMDGCSVVLVIVPLASIINDQITTLQSFGYPAADLKVFTRRRPQKV